ncbi:hypothetical protein IQ03_03889 [Gemmobacter caeni]|uniref:Secreted protein n=1 Tax=Gemmobacter caeni TaxID=589035 RepID=A0A2T6B9A6_9RHOB|nr:hypothetical protein [Gemmobacter caeni]PTX52655.1 hypothetical protein C8N34_102473 [Gemmobacter caeni]TWI94890.1 hypothetical protein IQ03_03889 [Gemmobacter caeni]
MRRLLITLLLSLPAPLLAAPAPTGQTCLIRGEVLDVSARDVARDPDWARSFGVSETVIYTDVTIRPVEISQLADGFSPSCIGETQTFQLDGEAPPVGACIRATAIFSGDEFRIGTWLTGVEPAPCD